MNCFATSLKFLGWRDRCTVFLEIANLPYSVQIFLGSGLRWLIMLGVIGPALLAFNLPLVNAGFSRCHRVSYKGIWYKKRLLPSYGLKLSCSFCILVLESLDVQISGPFKYYMHRSPVIPEFWSLLWPSAAISTVVLDYAFSLIQVCWVQSYSSVFSGILVIIRFPLWPWPNLPILLSSKAPLLPNFCTAWISLRP